MTLAGLELNAARLRALSGSAETPPRVLALDGQAADLPLAVSLEGRVPEVGRAGIELCRRLPHMACLGFLPHLGDDRQWAAGRHRLDAAAALSLVFQYVQPSLTGVRGLALAVPSYLARAQVVLLVQLAEQLRLPILGTVTTPLMAALAGFAEEPWSGTALVVDADDHALTWTALSADTRQVLVLDEQVLPRLGVRAWKERLLNAIADRCIRHSRRDPRESAAAEQMLYEQFDAMLDACRQGQVAELVIRAASWCQHMLVRPEDLDLCCAPLVRLVLDGMHAVLREGSPAAVLVTAAAAQLPGLLTALLDHTGEQTTVALLAPEAVAQAAHHLAARFQTGSLPRGHLDTAVPLSLMRGARSVVSKQKRALRIGHRLTGTDDWSLSTDE